MVSMVLALSISAYSVYSSLGNDEKIGRYVFAFNILVQSDTVYFTCSQAVGQNTQEEEGRLQCSLDHKNINYYNF